MRRLSLLALSILTLLAGLLVSGSGASAAAHRDFPATRSTVLQPVNGAGHARPGYSITSVPRRFWIDCRFPEASPGALSSGINYCSPSAAYAIACWKAAAAHKALCLTDARRQRLTRYQLMGRFTPATVRPADEQAPLAIVLADGDYCSIRDGGAWSQLPHHPNLYGYYSCRHDGAVWAVANARHDGVNESQPSWTVRTAQFGHRHLITRHVVRAWFVSTFTR